MSSINSRVPPLRLAAVDNPSDGEVAAYQSSSGQFEWVANGSGGGGTVTSVALTETGSALTITGSPITGSGTINIAGAGTSSQVILGDLTLGTLTSGTVTSVSSSQAFISIADPTTTPSISIGNASASATGVLTSTDWNTFNNKGSGTVTSVALTESGDALSISGSPITGSGTLNISGAGTSSQVILGDLSLGTLTNGTVTGTGAANQVSYWTSTTAQAGSTGLTYDPSTGNLTVGGYVETGTKVTTPSGTNLELSPGGASSGSIVIADGANGQISITPNGTGTVKIDGVSIDNSAIATGYVLKATSTTEAGWAAESGGGGITFPIEADSGNAGAPSYSFSADTDTGIYLAGASNMGIVAGGNSYLSIGSLGAVQFNRKALFNVATAAAPNAFATDTNTGFFQAAADTISLSNAGSETFRFGSSGEILVGGTASGASGQVLTSGGSGAAVSWTTVSGGGGSTDEMFIPYIWTDADSGFNSHRRVLNLNYGYTNSNLFSERISFIPFRAPRTETVASLNIYISTVYGTDPDDAVIGVYTSKSSTTTNNIIPKSLQFTATFDMGAGTGHRASSITVASGGSASLTKGDLYFLAYAPTNDGLDTNSQVRVTSPYPNGLSPGNSTRTFVSYPNWTYGDSLALDAESSYETDLESAGGQPWVISYIV